MPQTEKSPVLRRAEADYKNFYKKELQLISIGLLCWLAAGGLELSQVDFYQENLVKVGVGLFFIAILADIERQTLLIRLEDIKKWS
jgi:hypothetical protein